MLTINDKEYDEQDLNEMQLHLIRQVQNCRAQTEVLAAAEAQFTAALVQSVEAPVAEEAVEEATA